MRDVEGDDVRIVVDYCGLTDDTLSHLRLSLRVSHSFLQLWLSLG